MSKGTKVKCTIDSQERSGWAKKVWRGSMHTGAFAVIATAKFAAMKKYWRTNKYMCVSVCVPYTSTKQQLDAAGLLFNASTNQLSLVSALARRTAPSTHFLCTHTHTHIQQIVLLYFSGFLRQASAKVSQFTSFSLPQTLFTLDFRGTSVLASIQRLYVCFVAPQIWCDIFAKLRTWVSLPDPRQNGIFISVRARLWLYCRPLFYCIFVRRRTFQISRVCWWR